MAGFDVGGRDFKLTTSLWELVFFEDLRLMFLRESVSPFLNWFVE